MIFSWHQNCVIPIKFAIIWLISNISRINIVTTYINISATLNWARGCLYALKSKSTTAANQYKSIERARRKNVRRDGSPGCSRPTSSFHILQDSYKLKYPSYFGTNTCSGNPLQWLNVHARNVRAANSKNLDLHPVISSQSNRCCSLPCKKARIYCRYKLAWDSFVYWLYLETE